MSTGQSLNRDTKVYTFDFVHIFYSSNNWGTPGDEQDIKNLINKYQLGRTAILVTVDVALNAASMSKRTFLVLPREDKNDNNMDTLFDNNDVCFFWHKPREPSFTPDCMGATISVNIEGNPYYKLAGIVRYDGMATGNIVNGPDRYKPLSTVVNSTTLYKFEQIIYSNWNAGSTTTLERDFWVISMAPDIFTATPEVTSIYNAYDMAYIATQIGVYKQNVNFVFNISQSRTREQLLANPAQPGAVSILNHLADVETVVPPLNGQVLTYNSGTSLWVSATPVVPVPVSALRFQTRYDFEGLGALLVATPVLNTWYVVPIDVFYQSFGIGASNNGTGVQITAPTGQAQVIISVGMYANVQDTKCEWSFFVNGSYEANSATPLFAKNTITESETISTNSWHISYSPGTTISVRVRFIEDNSPNPVVTQIRLSKLQININQI